MVMPIIDNIIFDLVWLKVALLHFFDYFIIDLNRIFPNNNTICNVIFARALVPLCGSYLFNCISCLRIYI
jgi:hypothetical protein